MVSDWNRSAMAVVQLSHLEKNISLTTHKQLETHGCVPSTVVTRVLVLKLQTTSVYSAE